MKIAQLARTLTAASFCFAMGASVAAPALAQYYPPNYGGYNNGFSNDQQITGTVSSFGGYTLMLQRNGGTQQRRHGGNHHNNGRWNGNGNDQGDQGRDRDDNDDRDNGNHNNNGRWNNNNNNNNGGNYNGGYNGGYYGQNNGMTVRLHQGTIINPTGTTLQPGMSLRIWGHPNNDGTFAADRIDVANTGYRGY